MNDPSKAELGQLTQTRLLEQAKAPTLSVRRLSSTLTVWAQNRYRKLNSGSSQRRIFILVLISTLVYFLLESGSEYKRQFYGVNDVFSKPLNTETLNSNKDNVVIKPPAHMSDNQTVSLPPVQVQYMVLRAIGNDLPPRHKIGQSYDNVKFILENEPNLDGCKKHWLLNRILNQTEESRIISMLEEHGQHYTRLVMDHDEYSKRETRFERFPAEDVLRSRYYRLQEEKTQALIQDEMQHDRILYMMNNNGARNTMIRLGRQSGAEWILPLDGNCYFTESAWKKIMDATVNNGYHTKYFQIPMARLQNNDVLFDPDFNPDAKEEPQIMFHRAAKEMFDETLRYGRRPKVEILYRLGIKGPWDRWPRDYPWEIHKTRYSDISNDLAGEDTVPKAGWVARLYSGAGALEKGGAIVARGVHRSQGIQMLLNRARESHIRNTLNFTRNSFMAFNETVLKAEREAWQSGKGGDLDNVISQLLQCADYAIEQGPWSVIRKTERPPSRDVHDYYTPKPYFWPNPNTRSGLPYIRLDGRRVPGTELYDKESNKFDRTRLAAMYGNTTCLGLAHYFTGEKKYATIAARNIKVWFVNDNTRMNPHSKFAQIHWGENQNLGESTGVIEFKDFYFFLDIVRIIKRSGEIKKNESKKLTDWFKKYINYLVNSKQGRGEYDSPNNHGVYFDVQMSSLLAFVGDLPKLINHVDVARGRILSQFAEDGSLPHEMIRETQLHYMMFTLSGWYTLARLALNVGIDMFCFKASEDKLPPLMRGAIFTVPYFNSTWKHHQEKITDMQRMIPLYYWAKLHYPELESATGPERYPLPGFYATKPMFYEHDGIQQFWNLGLTDRYLAN
eukprot:CFRG7142T1